MQVYVCVYVPFHLLSYITYVILEETQAHGEDFMLLYLMCAWCCSSFLWYSSFMCAHVHVTRVHLHSCQPRIPKGSIPHSVMRMYQRWRSMCCVCVS